MITDRDINKMKAVFATSEDHIRLEEKVDTLAGTVNDLAGTVNEQGNSISKLSGTVTNLFTAVSAIKDRLDKVPTKEELMEMIDRTYGLAVLKAEHDRMKQILRERLSVEV